MKVKIRLVIKFCFLISAFNFIFGTPSSNKSRRLSALERLPPELLSAVFGYLPPDEIVRNVATVSQTLFYKIRDYGAKFVDLATESNLLPDEFSQIVKISRGAEGVTHISNAPEDMFMELLNKCKLSAKSLQLSGGVPPVYMDKYVEFAKEAAGLQSLKLYGSSILLLKKINNIEGLKSLVLNGDLSSSPTVDAVQAYLTSTHFDAFLGSLPKLAEFVVTNIQIGENPYESRELNRIASKITDITLNDYPSSRIVLPLEWLTNVQKLTMRIYLPGPDDEIANEIHAVSRHLKLLSNLRHLKQLTISANGYPSSENLADIFKTYTSSLVYLLFDESAEIDSDLKQLLFSKFPDIQIYQNKEGVVDKFALR
jgi:hypothetical protein